MSRSSKDGLEVVTRQREIALDGRINEVSNELKHVKQQIESARLSVREIGKTVWLIKKNETFRNELHSII